MGETAGTPTRRNHTNLRQQQKTISCGANWG
jgi:hypothetical protein